MPRRCLRPITILLALDSLAAGSQARPSGGELAQSGGSAAIAGLWLAGQEGTRFGQLGGPMMRPVGQSVQPFATKALRHAECLATPLVLSGDLHDGGDVSLYIAADDSGPGRRLVTVINGEPVYVPVPGDGRARPIMPMVERVSFVYSKIVTSDEPMTQPAGWFTAGVTGVRLNFVDRRDGTVEIKIPVAQHAMFAQTVMLSIKTDRCMLSVPMKIGPRLSYGRWYPPAFVSQCATRHAIATTFFEQLSMAPESGLSASYNSVRPHSGYIRNALFQDCGPYGAVHEGGNEDGVGHGEGFDDYLIWPGVDSATSVDIVGDCDVTKRVRIVDRDGSSIGEPRSRKKSSLLASTRVIHVNVHWKLKGVHDYCGYALVIRGQHPAELTNQWLTTWRSNNLGARTAMAHEEGKTTLRWQERDPNDERRLTTRSRTYAY